MASGPHPSWDLRGPSAAGLDQRHLSETWLPWGCFALKFFSGRPCDLNITPSLQEFRFLGFVPLGARALEECGESGIPMRWGAQRNPSKWLGALQDSPRETAWRRTRIQPPSFRTFITSHVSQVGTVAQARPHSGPLPLRGYVHRLPQESAHSRTFSWSICCMPSMVWVPRGMSSLALVAPVTFFGGHFKQELGNM